MIKLNESAGLIGALIDGERDVAAIIAELEVSSRMSRKSPKTSSSSWRWPVPNTGSSSPEMPAKPEVGLPLWLLAELTYRCPLQCPYCSNPLDFARQGQELSTEQWFRVMAEARELGAAQLASPAASRWYARTCPS